MKNGMEWIKEWNGLENHDKPFGSPIHARRQTCHHADRRHVKSSSPPRFVVFRPEEHRLASGATKRLFTRSSPDPERFDTHQDRCGFAASGDLNQAGSLTNGQFRYLFHGAECCSRTPLGGQTIHADMSFVVVGRPSCACARRHGKICIIRRFVPRPKARRSKPITLDQSCSLVYGYGGRS